MSVAVGFAKVNFASEPIAWPCTRAMLFGESVASETLRPLPVIGAAGVPGVVGVVETPPNAARDFAPK